MNQGSLEGDLVDAVAAVCFRASLIDVWALDSIKWGFTVHRF